MKRGREALYDNTPDSHKIGYIRSGMFTHRICTDRSTKHWILGGMGGTAVYPDFLVFVLFIWCSKSRFVGFDR